MSESELKRIAIQRAAAQSSAEGANSNEELGDVTFDSFMDEMQRLEDARNPIGAQDRRDAKRYRWLKDHGYANEKNASNAVIGDRNKARVAFRYWCSPTDLDALIDGAMLKSPNYGTNGLANIELESKK